MINSLTVRRVTAIGLALVMGIALPVMTYGNDGKKQFKQAMKFEQNKQWDEAARHYALAAAEEPSNVEYSMHLQRALVNAALMLVDRGDKLVEQKDYNAAYQAYRQAYSFDPTNELALIKMRRMLEVQGLPTNDLPKSGDPTEPSSRPRGTETGLRVSTIGEGSAPAATPIPTGQMPTLTNVANAWVAKRYPHTDLVFRPMSLMAAIEQLAQSMRLNVVFDNLALTQIKNNNTFSIELRDVTPAKALEIILETNGLMYTQEDTRTIVVASDNPQSRMRYEKQAVKTFYIKNAELDTVKQALASTIGTKQTVASKQLNALIVRDTPANLELAQSLIDSLDKSKAEVLIDVNLYEVSRNDMLQLGNQFNVGGSSSAPGNLGFLGGIGQSGVVVPGLVPRLLTGPAGIALGLPSSSVSFLQDKGKAKLLAATQVHVLDGEQHSVKIGQRVPIQTASYPFIGGTSPLGTTGTTPSTTTPAGTGSVGSTVANTASSLLGFGGGFGIPQIQYENVGLNIDMTPQVYEEEVQVKMKIESSSIDGSTSTLTPTFNQRSMSSVARIRDGQTTMIAGISQSSESKEVKGIPLIGLIPILGRFFATPNTTNTHSDVVMTVTPHILRRADIREEDHLARDVGPEQNPRRQLTLEQILYIADQEAAQVNPTAAGNGPAPTKPAASAANEAGTRLTAASPQPGLNPAAGIVVLPNGATAVQAVQTAVTPPNAGARPGQQARGNAPVSGVAGVAAKKQPDDDDDDDDATPPQNNNRGPINVSVRPSSPVATKGQQFIAIVIINGDAEISSATVALTYDPNILEIKAVRDGGLMRSGGATSEPQFSAQAGLLNVQMDRPAGFGGAPAHGQLLFIIFDPKGQGQTTLALTEQTSFRSATGQPIPVRLQSAQVEVK